MHRSVRIVGPGRAGSSLADALAAHGWAVAAPVHHQDDPADAACGVDLCVIATPDTAIPELAAAITPVPTTVVAHLAGSLGADILTPHRRRAALHPLVSLPDPVTGAAALRQGCWWAVDGDPLAAEVVETLGGRILRPTDRAVYHAAACVAANHLVILMEQVERLAAQAGIDPEPFYDLAAGALANARRVGADKALTGPAARGDVVTIERHLAVLDPGERELYEALVLACR